MTEQPRRARLIPVAQAGELEDRRVHVFEVDGRKVILVRLGDEVYALQGICTHAKSVLGPGALTRDCLIECPMHAALFSPIDGSVRKGPALVGLETYAVAIEDGVVHVGLPERVAAPAAPTRPERWW